MAEKSDEEEPRVGRLPKELVGVRCPRCDYKISQDTEIVWPTGLSRPRSSPVDGTTICGFASNSSRY